MITADQLLGLLPALSRLNSWCRVPFEQQLDMYSAVEHIYRYKTWAIREAIRLGLTGLRPLVVERPCKTCNGTGMFKRYFDAWGDGDWEGEDCRRCAATGKVKLGFIETNIGGFRWHTPRPKWNPDLHKFPDRIWEQCALETEWTPGGEGQPLDRWELISHLNTVERAITGGKLFRWNNGWRQYGLHLGEVEGCCFCGASVDVDGRKLHAGAIHRPGFRWDQAACWHHRPSENATWPHDLRPRWNRTVHDWGDFAPLPAAAFRPEVTEWLARRGIVIGHLPPDEYCYLPSGDFARVLAVTAAEIGRLVHVEECEQWRSKQQLSLPAALVSGRPRKLLTAGVE